MMIVNRTTGSIARLFNKWNASFGLFKFPLPDLGEKIKEGKVKKLYVKEGDRVEEFQKLADVQSDKQFTQISSPQNGTIKKLYFLEDQTCQVGEIFLDIQTGESSNTSNQTNSEVKQTKQQKQQPKPEPKKEKAQYSYQLDDSVLASTVVKMWAREHNIDLRDVKATGKKGRVLKSDIIYYLEDPKKYSNGIKSDSSKLKAKVLPQSRDQPIKEVKKVQMNQLEKLQQGLATYSTTIPHLFIQQIFDVTNLMPIIQGSKQKISLLSLLLKSFSLALSAHQRINSIYKTSDQFKFGMSRQQHVLLSLYGKTPLTYSMINNIQNQSILGIQKKIDGIEDGISQASKVKQMISKATINVSYIGEANAMTINPPIIGETICHVSIGDIREEAVWNKGQTQKRKQVSIVLGGDHRVMDGASAARFTTTWRDYSENPTNALLNMI